MKERSAVTRDGGMRAGDDGPSLLERVRKGGDPRLLRLAAQGLLPVAAHELVPLQVELATRGEAEVAELARQALAELEPRIVIAVLEEVEAPEVAAFFAAHQPHPLVQEAILRLRGVSPEVLKLLAPGLPADLQDVLLLRQDAIREDPSLLEALERNPRLSTTSRRRIQEYRRHLVADRLAATAGAVAEEDLAEEEVLQAIEGAREAEPQGELDEITGLTEGQVRTLPILVRLKLSRGASRSLRSILVRDPHPRVAVSVVKHNALSDSEIEQVAANRAVAEEVLEEIARHEIWIRKYPILHALARNPKTPTSIAVRLLPRLSVRDLRGLSRDRNASEAIRKKALRLYTIKRG